MLIILSEHVLLWVGICSELCNMANFSIIIPVYNASATLDECLKSIVDQTFHDYEVLLIDDGSSDDSAAICSKYVEKFDFFSYRYQENAGVSAARNLGIKLAKNDLVVFVDSDDCVQPNFLESLVCSVRKCSSHNSIVIHTVLSGSGSQWKKRNIHEGHFCGCGCVKEAVEHGLIDYSEPHSKVFFRKLLIEKQIYFPLGVKNGEDGIFIAKYLQYVDEIISHNEAIYIYRYYYNSASRRLYSTHDEWESFVLWKKELFFLFQKNRITDYAVAWKLLSIPFSRAIKAALSDNKYSLREKRRFLQNLPKECTLNYGSGRKYSMKGKVLKYLINHRLWLPLVILKR